MVRDESVGAAHKRAAWAIRHGRLGADASLSAWLNTCVIGPDPSNTVLVKGGSDLYADAAADAMDTKHSSGTPLPPVGRDGGVADQEDQEQVTPDEVRRVRGVKSRRASTGGSYGRRSPLSRSHVDPDGAAGLLAASQPRAREPRPRRVARVHVPRRPAADASESPRDSRRLFGLSQATTVVA